MYDTVRSGVNELTHDSVRCVALSRMEKGFLSFGFQAAGLPAYVHHLRYLFSSSASWSTSSFSSCTAFLTG